LKFDRALLLLLSTSKNELLGRMMLGKSDQDPKSIRRPLLPIASPRSPDAVAFAESRPIFNGNSLFDDGWPIAVVPIGFGKPRYRSDLRGSNCDGRNRRCRAN
jgi:hypothetical protein